MSTQRRHTTVDEAVAVIRRHRVVRVDGRVMSCACGRWFETPDRYSGHLLDEAETQLSSYVPRHAVVTLELLGEVADVYRAAPDGAKTRAVAEFLGVGATSAGTYLTRARKAGLLEPSARMGRAA